MDYYFITVPQRPIAKSNMYGVRVVGQRKSDGSVKNPKAIMYTKKELEDYELMIGNIVNNVIPETINTYASLYVRVYQKGKKWIDLDNTFKAIQDSMDTGKKIKRGKNEIQICNTGIKDDKLFQLIMAERIHIGKDEEERVELIITEYNGIFHLVDCIKEQYGIVENYTADLFLPEI